MASLHVVKRGDDWGVRREHAGRVSALADTQLDAFDLARKIAKVEKLEVIVHNKHGRFGWRNSYGNDPESSKG